jgi:beta-lactamase superfamily II metal-dependent hydrolase
MAWVLEISTIDVGQGESSLIIARDVGGPGGTRTMLIDGGRPNWAVWVHTYVSGRLAALGIAQLDHLVVTHYDLDHSGGVVRLLISDNLWVLSNLLANSAATAWAAANGRGRNANQRRSAAAAAAAAAARGGYNRPGKQCANVAVNAAAAAETIAVPNAVNGAEYGRQYADAQPTVNVNMRLLVTPALVRGAGVAAGTAAEANAGVAPPVTTAVFGALQNSVTGAIDTGGLYRNVNVIDIGDTYHVPTQYLPALVSGQVYFRGGTTARPPGANRTRTSVQPANLGAELLWNSGPGPIAAPANSPAAFLVANNKYIWRAPMGTCPIASGEPENDDSIALIIRFGQFFFYTGGDLPTVGEDLVGNAVFANGLPNPQGGAAFPLPARIAAFKLGHHGSDRSTSNTFLNRINARAAVISCGFNGFGKGDKHPTQAVINRLQAHAGVDPFYLTNCNYITTHIPASNGQDQLAALNNRSRVCGDNGSPNVAPGRHRGDSRLYINQAESTAGPGVGRSFHIDYWDADDNPFAPAVGGVQPPIGAMTEDHQY